MQLWLRYKTARELEYDEKISVKSQEEWHSLICNPNLISSILFPNSNLFQIKSKHFVRRHPHEINYENSSKRNQSYLSGCKNLADKLNQEFAGSRCLIYAPLRGALPIWRGIQQFLKDIETKVYYPVTSSFISFPKEFEIIGKRNWTASGRYNNRFELERLCPFLDDFDYLIYVDEIVSGGMMKGHLKDMFRMKIDQRIPIVSVGLADAFGRRATPNILVIEELVRLGKLKAFIWEGCKSLITEDQKYLLGIHYVDYKLGPHIIPVLDENLEFYPEKKEFDREVYTNLNLQNTASDYAFTSL